MREIKKARFETEDKVRPVIGTHKGEMGIVKEVHDIIQTPTGEPTYKVRFEVQSQFGYADYEYIWYTERELSPNVLSPVGFSMEASCAKASQ